MGDGTSDERRYWLGVVSREHVEIGVRGGFAQLNHGKKAPLQRLRGGDGVVFYSPRTSYPAGEPLRMFTALGFVTSGEVYQVDMGGGFVPYRVDVRYLDAEPAPIEPLLDGFTFIRDPAHWGAAFRFGSLRIAAADFALVARAMGADLERGLAAADSAAGGV